VLKKEYKFKIRHSIPENYIRNMGEGDLPRIGFLGGVHTIERHQGNSKPWAKWPDT
jgi:hypothetical protein